MQFKNEFELAELISHQLLGLLTPQEEKQLEEWLDASQANRALYDTIAKGKSFRAREELESRIDIDQVCRKMEDKRKTFVLSRRILKTASVAALFLLGGITSFLLLREQQNTAPSIEMASTLSPGSTKAILTLFNGEQKILTEKETAEDLQRLLASSVSPNQTPETLYNKIEIPRGGEYQITLADGTRVWLNAESIFEYPVNFSERQRVVRLSGEAYFEVAHDSSSPFEILTNDDVRIKVLGTTFNVHSYKDSSDILITLVEGAVAVGHHQTEARLAPNQQAVFDRSKNKLTVRDVPDARTYCSWKNGMFVFEGESLEIIIEALSKWYDVEIISEQIDLKQYGHFSMNIDRGENLIPILTMMKQITGLAYRIEGKKVYLSQ